ncbi:peptidylprolyl isomerase [Sphingorhabdus lacus]|jgi:peptidyl-prolyl cis-trans isomerase D|uniref:Parvulin-like PPIase n=1 Tax=Sphingorhabdus lacus TaxID=392610 RepID=A0A6I6LC74_9SPHN|nr:peptidylprolyl isomerase [Sphingorhabdus lacus]QGY79883.1 peptidylprolyl isomerase [Sphingorhabdus lacus]
MISSIRSLINSKFGAVIALLFVGMIAIAFALGDVTGSGSFGGLSGGNVARVGDRNITLGELNDALDNRLRAERQNNPTLDMANFVEGGGLDSTLEQLINRYALAEFGTRYGVAVSDRLIGSEIRKLPGAMGLDGKFSAEAFRAFAQQIGVSEQAIRDDITQNLFAQQIIPAAASGPAAPDSMVLPYASLVLEQRSGQVASIPSTAFFPPNPPSETVLAKYYNDNAAKFTIPEKRAISYAIFDKSIIAARAKPSEADIAAYYKANAAKYAASQTRNISQVIVPTEAAAKSVVAQVTAGKSLAEVANGLGLAVTTMNNVAKANLAGTASPAIADAVFAAAKGTVAKPARGKLGWAVVRVDAINQVAAKSLAAARAEIETELTKTRGEEMLTEMTAEIEDSFADGSTITDMAKQNGLKVETSPKLLANGQNTANPGYKPIPEMQVILPAAFQLDTNGEAQLVELVPGEKFAMIAVADFDEAAPPPLADVRPIVQQQWALAEGAKAARAAAERIRKAVDGGQPLQTALSAANIQGAQIESIKGTRADLSRQGQQIAPPVAMMFAMKKGTAKTLQGGGNRGWYIVYLTDVVKGDARGNTEMLLARKQEISGLLQTEYGAQLIAAAAKDVGVTKNDDGIAELRARLTNRDGN